MADHPVTEPEEWRPVPGHPGYEASSLGRIRSMDRWVAYSNGHQHFHSGAILRPMRRGKYHRVNLGPTRGKAVHVIICTVFHGKKPSKRHHVAHWNGNAHDDRAANLRWATPKQNKADDLRNGTRYQGSKCRQAILAEQDVIEIRRLRAVDGLTLQAIGNKYEMTRSRIWDVCFGRSWRHVPRPDYTKL